MKQNNQYNLPEHVIRLLPKFYKPDLARIGVTSLIDEPRIRTLLIKNWDKIERDISQSLTTLDGIIWHKHAAHEAQTDEQAEQKLEDNVDSKGNPLGLTLVGKADNYLCQNFGTDKPIYQIRDWKRIKVYALKFPETVKKYTAELNCYAWQRRKRGQQVDSLWLDVFWKDWKYENWERAEDKTYISNQSLPLNSVFPYYPPIPYTEIKLSLWTFEEQEIFIKNQIEYHIQNPMACADRWQTEPCFAVMKEGRKSALRVLDTYEKALEYCYQNDYLDFGAKGLKTKLSGCQYSLKKDISIVKREGKCIRCGSHGWYCSVYSVCPDAVR